MRIHKFQSSRLKIPITSFLAGWICGMKKVWWEIFKVLFFFFFFFLLKIMHFFLFLCHSCQTRQRCRILSSPFYLGLTCQPATWYEHLNMSGSSPVSLGNMSILDNSTLHNLYIYFYLVLEELCDSMIEQQLYKWHRNFFHLIIQSRAEHKTMLAGDPRIPIIASCSHSLMGVTQYTALKTGGQTSMMWCHHERIPNGLWKSDIIEEKLLKVVVYHMICGHVMWQTASARKRLLKETVSASLKGGKTHPIFLNLQIFVSLLIKTLPIVKQTVKTLKCENKQTFYVQSGFLHNNGIKIQLLLIWLMWHSCWLINWKCYT